jgi:putative endonuclease
MLSFQGSSPKRRSAEIRGRRAEDAVAASWEADGYEILARRLRTRSGEIDLVAANADKLVFIEVKARRTLADAAYAVLPRQQSRLLDAAGAALALHESWHRPEIRFDVALVCDGAIHTIKDAIRYN